MGIPLSSNFDIGSGVPIDSRMVVTDVTARNAIANVRRYQGLAVFVVADSKTYQLQGGTADINWVELGTGSGSMVYPGIGIAVSTGSSWGTSITDNSANWNTAYSDRMKWDGGSTGLTAATGRTSLGGTTVGQNIFTLTNPGAISFIKVAADNTASAESATNYLTSLGGTTVGKNVFGLANPGAITFLKINADNTVTAETAANHLSAIGAAAASHAHGNITSAGAIGSTSGLPIITTTSGVLTVGSFGSTSGTFCAGDDTRLSDSRTPTAHVLNSGSHTVSGLTTGHFLKATGATSFGFAAHGLTASDVGAAASSHTHGNITNAGAIGVTSGLPIVTGASGVLETGTFGLSHIGVGSAQYQIAVTGSTPFTPTWTAATNLVGSSGLNGLTWSSGTVLVGMTAANTFGLQTGANVTALLSTFSTSSTAQGVVPGSNNVGTTYFLRADGTWAVPAGGSGTTPVDSTLLDWSTDRYQAYAAAAAGAFDSSSTTPTGTTRMNYGGYFYATRLYEGALRVMVGDSTQKITVGTSTPSTPATGDLWIDTN